MRCYMTSEPCRYSASLDETEKVFIISPFGYPYDRLYGKEGVVQESLRTARLAVSRSDDSMRLGWVMCRGICQEIMTSKYILADVTEPNPNVYYELGLAAALGKRVLLCCETGRETGYAVWLKTLIRQEAQPQGELGAWIGYTSVTDLLDRLKGVDFRKSTWGLRDDICQVRPPEWQCSALVLESSDAPVVGLIHSMMAPVAQQLSRGPAGVPGGREDRTFSWSVETLTVGGSKSDTKDSHLGRWIARIIESDVCVVDTSARRSGGIVERNPLMYFALGLAHGAEVHTIPVTDARGHPEMPFDVRGLWHIFFQSSTELEGGLRDAMTRIGAELREASWQSPFRKIWDGALRDLRSLRIIYCGRPVDGADQNYLTRTKRTSIDSWDSQAVTEAAFLLKQRYPHSIVEVLPPEAKQNSPGDPDFLRRRLGRSPSCLIVGSPDNNDYAEVALAEAFGKSPFAPHSQPRGSSKMGFVFVKENLKQDIASAFYRPAKKGETSAVEFPEGDRIRCSDVKTCGILTILDNRFVSDPQGTRGIIICLSGFTGPATYGLLKLLTSGQEDVDQPVERRCTVGPERWRYLLERYIVPKYVEARNEGRVFSVPVVFQLGSIPGGDGEQSATEGDQRCIVKASVQVCPVHAPMQGE